MRRLSIRRSRWSGRSTAFLMSGMRNTASSVWAITEPSHSYVAETLAAAYGSTGKAISCHLGGSGSLCAIDDGKSVDTSFGISLQVGIIQSNRCGDIDPFIVPFLQKEGMSLDEVLEGLTKRGGLLGISGVSNDLRDVEEAGPGGK